MTPFTRLDAIAAPLPLANVDTDKILAARFMKIIDRKGLRRALFASLREKSDFVLNHAPWDRAGILVALDNFGCGSSREHAPWALLDFGFRCIIAPGFADIFYANCFKNGMLPVTLPRSAVDALLALVSNPQTARLMVDLDRQSVSGMDGQSLHFDIDARRKRDLLDGIDDIRRSMGYLPDIVAFEAARRTGQPWIVDITQTGIDTA